MTIFAFKLNAHAVNFVTFFVPKETKSFLLQKVKTLSLFDLHFQLCLSGKHATTFVALEVFCSMHYLDVRIQLRSIREHL
jgi:hypothetical protein